MTGDTAPFTPPKPPTQKRRFIGRMLSGSKFCYISNFIDKSYEMKMGYIGLPGRRIFMPCEHELVRKVLVTEAEHYPKSDLIDRILVHLIGNGVFSANGEEWKRQRRLIDPAFVHAKLKRVFPAMNDAVSDLIKRLDLQQEGSVLEVDEEMTHITADVIFRTMFSTNLEQEGARRLLTAFNEFQDTAFAIGLLQALRLPNFLFIRKFRAKRAARKIRALIEPFVNERYDLHQKGELSEQDILSSLVKAVDPETGQSFTRTELVNQTAFLFLAGHETSASALSWALYLLANKPDVQERVYQEVNDVLGDREPAYEDIRRLRFVRDVFQETLRLYPPVGALPREASRCEHMRNREVKPGDMVIVSTWLMHRHRNYWEQPDVFDPDRYADGGCKASLRNAYMPFSLGPRICTGAGFAKQEAMIVLAALVRRYRFEPVEDHVPIPVGRLTIRSENGIRLYIHRR